MKRDRGQACSDPVAPAIVTIAGVVVFVVAKELESIQADPGEFHTLCNGMFGCDGIQTWEIVPPLLFVGVTLLGVGSFYLYHRRRPDE